MITAELCPSRRSIADLTALLQECLPSLKQTEPSRWTFSVAGRTDLQGSVRTDENWLILEMSAGWADASLQSETLIRWLTANAALTGACKYLLTLPDGSLCLRAEHLCDEEQDDSEVRQACRAFLEAVEKTLELPAIAWPVDTSSVDPETIKTLCTEAGWPLNEHNSVACTVPLDVPEAFYQATVEGLAGGGIRLFVELAIGESLSQIALRAVCILLLATSAHVRMIRATGHKRGAGTALGLEVAIPWPVGAASLACALSALSIGCAMCGREVDVFQDERIARQYLEWQGVTL